MRETAAAKGTLFGEPRLGLADQVDGQKPDRQSQVSALEQGPGDQRGLLTAGLALEGLMGADVEDVGVGLAALGAAKSLGPARLLERHLALGFRAELGGGRPVATGRVGTECGSWAWPAPTAK